MAALDDGAIDHRQTIAALRRELDQCTAERDEALAQQLATSEILGVISCSPTDTQPVFEAIVGRAAALCEAEFSAVARLEDGLLHLVAVHSMSPEEIAAFHSLFPRPPTRNFTMGRAFVDARPVHFADVLTEFDYDTRTIEVLQSVAKYRSFLGVPIFREGRPIGVIGCGRREVRPFAAAQIDLVKTFAAQAAIAIEDVRLFGELEIRNRDLGEALEQQTATAEILEVINRSPGNLAPVFEAMVKRAVQLCEADEAAVRSFDGKLLHLVAAHGEPDVLDKLRELGPSDLSRPGGLYDPFLRGERVVHIADVRETETFRDKPIARKRLEVRNIRTWLAVALGRESKLLGVINVHRHEVRPFSEKQIVLLESFAAQAVIAMENARLLTETREALEQQTATAEVLGVINSSPGDLAPVFEAILDKAHTLCGATLGSLFLYDGELFRAAATYGYPEDLAQRLRQGVVLSAAPQLLMDDVRWVHNPDLTLIDTPTARAVSGRGGVRTNLMLPLRKDGKLLGAISCNRQEVRPFSEKEIALLQNFATGGDRDGKCAPHY
jgi:two-component system NtrC family sensor kinase